MTKNVIKEIFIVVLLFAAITLLTGVILYDYVPANRAIPAEISYSTPQNVKEELKAVKGVDEDEVILTYKIDETDLYNYQRVNDYKPGKTNPFSTYKTESVENNSTNGNNTTPSSSSKTTDTNSVNINTNTGTSKNTSTTEPGTVNPGNYTNNKGLK